VFRRVSACLAPGGHFIFDVVTNCHTHEACGRRFCRSSGPVRQCVTPHCASNLVTMSVEIHDPCGVGTTIERHVERLYAPATIGAALRDAGFVIRGVHDAATLRPADRCPPRLIIVARR
jgi:hypothetical protein